ncbi:DUF481 domain-containing protein [Vulgatibacter sp.]|uniref:DUF481 domain-containing protein n=1 Tax=Vulgatibacter sp. TaxID=1971226 RepID=UPI00356AADD6
MIRTALAALVLLLPLAAPAARIVNVQPAASKGAVEGISGEISGLLNWTTGNTEVTQISGAAAGLYLTGRHRIYLTARASYGLDDEEAFINNLFEHLRYRYRLLPWLSPETFVQHEYDEFRRLQLRALFGLGPRFDLPLPRGYEVAIGTAWMLEYERFTEGDEVDAGEEELNQRWSSYVFASAIPTDGIALTHTTYVQPKFDEFDDYRLLSETAAILDVKTWLAVKLAFTSAYDSEPPDGVEKLDTSFTTSLLFRL